MIDFGTWSDELNFEEIKKIVGEDAYYDQFIDSFVEYALADIREKALEDYFKQVIYDEDVGVLEEIAETKDFKDFWWDFKNDLLDYFEEELSKEYEDLKADENYISDLESEWRNSRGVEKNKDY